MNELLNLIYFIILTYSISYIIVESEIFRYFREKITINFFKKLINCMTCSSFWVALGLSFFITLTGYNILDGLIGLGFINILQKIISF